MVNSDNYSYDDLGNLLNIKTYDIDSDVLMSTNTYSYLNSNWEDQLTKFNDDIITYDEIGNPVSIGTKVLTWKNGRELATYTDDNLSISYSYNVNGIRTSKTVNGVTTKYALEGNKVLYESTNNTQIYYIYNGGDLLGFICNDIKYYYRKNMFGDIIGIYDSSYKEVVEYKYDSYGNIISIIDNSTNKIGTINPFRYRSYYYDNETKLYYLNSRYYNPLWGRFINGDSILTQKEGMGYNLYEYTLNNFVNRIDKNGMIWRRLRRKAFWFSVGILADKFYDYEYFSKFLIHSLKIKPTNLVFNSSSDLSNKISKDADFNAKMNEVMATADRDGNVNYDSRTNGKGGITFEQDRDLKYALHNVHIQVIGNVKTGDLHVKLYDKYDFKLENPFDGDLEHFLVMNGNNLAYIDQLLRNIKTYNIFIDVEYSISNVCWY